MSKGKTVRLISRAHRTGSKLTLRVRAEVLDRCDPLACTPGTANTLLFRSEGLRVAVVRDGRAELVPVKLGRDYGRTVEVVSGLSPTDAIIVDPADSLVSGTAVRVIERPTETKKP